MLQSRPDFKLSEIDTQVLLIEPVLKIAGWDCNSYEQVRRAHRRGHGPKMEFDIEVYSPKNNSLVTIAIECKSLNTPYNLTSKKGVGQLHRDNEAAPWWQTTGDDIGQLRAYCVKYSQFAAISIAVLTNGFDWLIFNTETFTLKSKLINPIIESDLKAHSQLDKDNFEEKIIGNLKPDRTIQVIR